MLINVLKNNLIHRTHKRLKPVLKNKKTASYFTITLSLFSLSLFGLFAIRPTLITAVTLIKEVKDLRNLSLDYEKKISNIITAQAEYEKIRDSVPLIDKALPQYSDFPQFTSTMERLAFENQIEITQLQIDSAPISLSKPKNELKNFNFIMIGIGSYENAHSYIDGIVNSLRLITIDSLDFSPEGGTVSGTLRISLKGKAYYEP